MTQKRTDTPTPQSPAVEAINNGRPEPAMEQIREALRDLRYGQVTIIVQDGVIVQIDRIERKRLT